MPAITGKQLKSIWGLARQLGMDYDHLHVFISANFRGILLKDLSRTEGTEVIDALVLAGAKIREGKGFKRALPSNVIELVTREQRIQIVNMERNLGWESDPNLLKEFVQGIIGKDRIARKEEASAVIAELKCMLVRTREKGAASDEMGA